MKIRLAGPRDGSKIIELYHEVYRGTYTDSCMTDHTRFRATVADPSVFWFVAEEDGEIVGSLVIHYDAEHLLGKAHGGAVLPSFQGKQVITSLMREGLDWLNHHTGGVDVVYATTRSVHEAAQTLVEHFGFKKLGIFPNTHKAAGDYETHSLAAWFSPEAFEKRFIDYKFHARLRPWLELVRAEIPDMNQPSEFIIPEEPTRILVEPPALEIVQAEKFVDYRYAHLAANHALGFEFFPFHRPNMVVTSPDQAVEIFCQFNTDGHCVLLGGKVPKDVSYTKLLMEVNQLLRDRGARYIEMIVRADKPKIVESVMRAKMIPSAFFPAFQLKDGKRWDFLVFSRSFEIFDFHNIRLKGLNQRFLEEYYKAWKSTHLNQQMRDV